MIDDKVRWAGVRAVHDGYDLTRQAKLSLLRGYFRNEGSLFNLRVCYMSADGTNCSRCEKCCRTIVGLLVEGLDPNEHGLQFTDESLPYIRAQFERGGFLFEASMWKDIQKHVESQPTTQNHGLQGFFSWFRIVSLDDLERLSLRRNRMRNMVLGGTTVLPVPIRNAIRRFLRIVYRLFTPSVMPKGGPRL